MTGIMESEPIPSGAPAPRRPVRLARTLRRYRGPIVLVLFLALLAGSFALGRYSVYRAHPELAGQDQAAAVLAKVGQLMQLPQGENPSMARVTDAAQVRQAQPFLSEAQNDDILIIYQRAGTAILYRPSTNKLIAVGPVTAQQAQKAAASAEAAPSDESAPHATTTTKK